MGNEIKLVEPAVYVVGRQTVDDAELSRFLTDNGVAWESDSEVAAEVLSETAGRTCYMSFARPRPGGNAAYLTHLLEVGHGSCIEHSVWNLLITGVSRSLTHELVRHRAGFGFSQLSQRYVDESVAEYVEPEIIANDPELHRIWIDTVRQSHAAYCVLAKKLSEKLTPCPTCGGDGRVGQHHDPASDTWRGGTQCLDCYGSGTAIPGPGTESRKAARQAARSVLPNATETKIFVTLNARAARHFIEQRGSRHAEPEIRRLAGMVLDALQKEAPNLFNDFTRDQLPDGSFELTTPYKKV